MNSHHFVLSCVFSVLPASLEGQEKEEGGRPEPMLSFSRILSLSLLLHLSLSFSLLVSLSRSLPLGEMTLEPPLRPSLHALCALSLNVKEEEDKRKRNHNGGMDVPSLCVDTCPPFRFLALLLFLFLVLSLPPLSRSLFLNVFLLALEGGERMGGERGAHPQQPLAPFPFSFSCLLCLSHTKRFAAIQKKKNKQKGFGG